MAAALVGAVLAAPSAGVAASTGLPLTERVLGSGDIPGYRASGAASVAFTPKAYAAILGEKDEVRPLTRAGFVRAATRRLAAGRDALVFSFVVQYETPAGARGEVARRQRKDRSAPGANPSALPVPRIPGAKGLALNWSQPPPQSQVIFADGPFLYLETVLAKGATQQPLQGALLRASERLYAKVRGAPPPEG